eukprot:9746338-Alexandrium_andersonii.AAC.1
MTRAARAWPPGAADANTMPRVTMPPASPGDQQGRGGTAPRAPGRDECVPAGRGNAQGPTLAGPGGSRRG